MKRGNRAVSPSNDHPDFVMSSLAGRFPNVISRLMAWPAIGLAMILIAVAPVYPGVFMLAETDPDTITHPPHYTGRGGEIYVTVGIAPQFFNRLKKELPRPVLNAINTWNGLVPTLHNIRADNNNVPREQIDFESVLLHELGHCIGLNHPHFDRGSGVPSEARNYTKTTQGANGGYDFDPGTDGVAGSSDDLRGDDVNLHWFQKFVNNPFQVAPTVDRSTYSRDLGDLPSDHLFAANGNQSVGNLLGWGNSEAVMHQGIGAGEARRTLSADDVATLRLAMSGFDGVAGTEDDYTVVLGFNSTASSDIVLDIDSNQTALARCEIRANDESSPGYFVITEGRIFFNDDINWFFNQEQPVSLPGLQIVANQRAGSVILARHEYLRAEISLQIPDALLNHPADYWLRAETPAGVFWLDNQLQFIRSDQPVLAYGGPSIPLARFPVLDIPAGELPSGEYLLTFTVDGNQNGILEGNFQDLISITILP